MTAALTRTTCRASSMSIGVRPRTASKTITTGGQSSWHASRSPRNLALMTQALGPPGRRQANDNLLWRTTSGNRRPRMKSALCGSVSDKHASSRWESESWCSQHLRSQPLLAVTATRSRHQHRRRIRQVIAQPRHDAAAACC